MKKQLKLIQIILFKLGDDVSDTEEDIDDLESNVEDTAECLADFKEDTTHTLTNLETTVDAIEHPCGGSDDWVKVVDFDMTVDGTKCPDDWVLSMYSLLTCGRPPTSTTRNQCFGANFPFLTGTMMTFSKVCGRIKAYAYGGPDGFEAFAEEDQTQITDAYVSGISLTAGSGFSEHLWTFAAGLAELGRMTYQESRMINVHVTDQIHQTFLSLTLWVTTTSARLESMCSKKILSCFSVMILCGMD